MIASEGVTFQGEIGEIKRGHDEGCSGSEKRVRLKFSCSGERFLLFGQDMAGEGYLRHMEIVPVKVQFFGTFRGADA